MIETLRDWSLVFTAALLLLLAYQTLTARRRR